MKLLSEAMNGLGAALLPMVAGLLLEELTFGGLVRLLMTPRQGAGKHGVANDRSSSPVWKRGKQDEQKGEEK